MSVRLVRRAAGAPLMRWFRRLVFVIVVTAIAWDLTRPPSRQWSTHAALAAIHTYQTSISPHVAGAGVRCRFTPSCSRYAETVIRRDGLVKGGWLALRRVTRCGPWTPLGTPDPPA